MPKGVKIAIIIAIVLTIILIVVYRKGKKAGATNLDALDLPSDSENKLTPIDKVTVSSLAKELFEEMNGVNVWRSIKPYSDLNALSDTQFVAVLNDFDTLVIKSMQTSKGNFRQWLIDEWMKGTDAEILKKTLLSRMDRLKINHKTSL